MSWSGSRVQGTVARTAAAADGIRTGIPELTGGTADEAGMGQDKKIMRCRYDPVDGPAYIGRQ